MTANARAPDCARRDHRHAWHPVKRRRADRRTNDGTAGWFGTASEQIVQRQRLASLVFLESFPLGCGITGYQALAAGVPVLSYLDRNTIFGMQYWDEVAGAATRERLDEYPLLCARDAADYVTLASRLIADRGFRDAWTARETAFYREEIAGIARYSRRFFDTVLAIPAAEGR